MSRQLVWLRNDLRLSDHPALYMAMNEGVTPSFTTEGSATHMASSQNELHIVVTLTAEQWKQHSESYAKQSLRLGLIDALDKECRSKGIKLHKLHLKTFSDCPSALMDLCRSLNCKSIWWQTELPLDEIRRDQAVEKELNMEGIQVHALAPDLFVSQPVLNNQGDPFKVFTPYYKRWIAFIKQHPFYPYTDVTNTPHAHLEAENSNQTPSQDNDRPEYVRHREDLWPACYHHIKETLTSFCRLKESRYAKDRDYPATTGTSLLSPYLSLGAIGPRELLSALKDHHQDETDAYWADSVWLKELAWRDFYKQLMWHYPQLSKHKAFKPETEQIVWSNNDEHFKAWCEGKTGFPIVDAAMRQLNQTGWMHNRLRMITASFLTKLLFIDWRKGERYFMEHLIDGEFAANNGGWQWSASTGCDAVPYFRVFNPTTQSKRYDSEGNFIKRFIPELKNVSAKEIHAPSSAVRQQCSYPTPIIDYKSARQNAIDQFSNLKK